MLEIEVPAGGSDGLVGRRNWRPRRSSRLGRFETAVGSVRVGAGRRLREDPRGRHAGAAERGRLCQTADGWAEPLNTANGQLVA